MEKVKEGKKNEASPFFYCLAGLLCLYIYVECVLVLQFIFICCPTFQQNVCHFFFVNLWFTSGFFTLEFGLVYNINLINGMAKFLLIR